MWLAGLIVIKWEEWKGGREQRSCGGLKEIFFFSILIIICNINSSKTREEESLVFDFGIKFKSK